MKAHHSRLKFWLRKARVALGDDWERCDEQTGRECRGEKCQVGAHRAMAYLDRAVEHAEQEDELQRLLLTAIKVGLQEHEPYAGYKITMLRQALEKASGHRKGRAEMARWISEVFDCEVQTDDEPFEKRDRQLARIWNNANKEQRAIIDDVLITLCGWSFDTLRKMAREKEDQ